jgi:hypothetical protein
MKLLNPCCLNKAIVVLAVFLSLGASAATHYVDLNSTNPVPPYESWPTAATNIQDAVDAAAAGDEVVVTNGTYATGGRSLDGLSTNRVAVTNALTLRSVNGPQFTTIEGYQVPGAIMGPEAIRCVYLAGVATLSGFTLAHGATVNRGSGDPITNQSGAGVWCEWTGAVVRNCVLTGNVASWYGGGCFAATISNCTINGNLAGNGGGAGWSHLFNCTVVSNSASEGGGAWYGTLTGCTLTGNHASTSGGGIFGCSLFNCTLTGNSAGQYGGGAYGVSVKGPDLRSKLWNCIVYFNTASGSSSNFWLDTYLNYCSTAPMPTSSLFPPNGIGCITNEPLFIDLNGGNLRLRSNSPCINAGTNAYASGATDLDGRLRIVGGTVDLGAYEFQPGVSGEFIAWLQQHGLPTDGSADAADADGDGMNNFQEWGSGTDPTNSLSALRLLSVAPVSGGLSLTWQSVTGVNYFVQRSPDLAIPQSFVTIATNLPGSAGATSFNDTNAVGDGPLFYRVGVGN